MQRNSPKVAEDENSIQYTSGGFANRFVNRSFTLAKIKEGTSGAKLNESSNDESSMSPRDNKNSLNNSDNESCGSLSVEEWFSEDSIQKEIDEQNEFDDRV